jgi:hypothetical protein
MAPLRIIATSCRYGLRIAESVIPRASQLPRATARTTAAQTTIERIGEHFMVQPSTI